MAKPIMNEKTIADYMKRNKCSREEAIELIEYDTAVANDEETEYDLTPEQKQNVQEMNKKVEHKKLSNIHRERKPNELKEAIVVELANFFKEEAQGQMYENVQITNKNRMISFSVGEKNFEVTLIEKRPPKNK